LLDGGEELIALTEETGFERRLAATLGQPVLDPGLRQLLSVALTHSSYVHEAGCEIEDNERLEFLGDAVLDLCVAEILWLRYPDLAPGDLTRIRADVVSGSALARVAEAWDLGAALRLGRGEDLDGGRGRSSNLSRAYEAVLAAIYLGMGYPATLRVVEAALGDWIDALAAGASGSDTKSALQELAQARGLTPSYQVLAREGPDHAPTWSVRATVGEDSADASAGSRRQAEKAAAGQLLSRLLPR
jgi:ribonuclease-3